MTKVQLKDWGERFNAMILYTIILISTSSFIFKFFVRLGITCNIVIDYNHILQKMNYA